MDGDLIPSELAKQSRDLHLLQMQRFDVIYWNSHQLGGKHEQKKLWHNLMLALNALGHGEKTIEESKKTLTDWKRKTKIKSCKLNSHRQQTGGGSASNISLSSFEERLLNLMGRSAVEGNPSVREFGIPSDSIIVPATSINASSLPIEIMDTDIVIPDMPMVNASEEMYETCLKPLNIVWGPLCDGRRAEAAFRVSECSFQIDEKETSYCSLFGFIFVLLDPKYSIH
ncbi:hypothetical protein CBL_10766 [Carabus blaptoides fortunei]